jgi:nitrogen regulatory protein PII
MSKKIGEDMDLITAVVRQPLAQATLKAAIAAGAPGITYFVAQGTGIKETLGYVGSLIEHEKTILWIVVKHDHTEKVLKAVAEAANLNLPGEGLAYVQPVTAAIGFLEPKR